jgi:hypothetical protein
VISFQITGPIDGVVRTLTWVKGVGFDESIAGIAAQNAVRIGAEVCATPTGPCYEASDRPAHVAFLSGLSVFDRRARNIKVEGARCPASCVGWEGSRGYRRTPWPERW